MMESIISESHRGKHFDRQKSGQPLFLISIKKIKTDYKT